MSETAPQAAPWVFLVRRLWPLMRPFAGLFALAVAAMLGDALLTSLRPWPLKVVVDRVLHHRASRVPLIGRWLSESHVEPMTVLYGACAATLLIAVLTGLLTYFFTHSMGQIGQRFVVSMRRALFAHMQRLSLRYHDRQRTGDLVHRLTSDMGNLREVITQGSILLISNAGLLVAMVCMMVWLNWKFALAALSVAPVLFATVFRYTGRIRTATRAARTSDGLLAALAQETLASIRIVQGLSRERHQEERYSGQSEASLRAHLESVRYQARVAPLVDVLAAAGLAIVMWYGATRVLAGELTTGDVIVFFAYVTNLYAPMKALAKLNTSVSKARVAAERIADVLREESEVKDRPGAIAAPRLRGRIEFRSVGFGYEPGRPVLASIDLTVEPGERVAIVGSTGAGKSTLVSLVPRLFDPGEGEVLIDGRDARDYLVASLREQVSMVLQDALLFSGTIRDNIAFGRPGAAEEEIVAAAVAANADEFIRRLPGGYDAVVSERGSSLSGGEKQRITIARAILRDAPILILDEPTSGLDAASERAVVAALERVTRGRTALMIAHRMATVRMADRIVVLEEGRIVEGGTHTELLDRNGRYAVLSRASV